MLTYSFSDIGSQSLYEYLYKCIKHDILGGVLACGDRLPSKRSFAKHLNVSTITIENAYAQLLAEGYIYSIPKKGYYVADISSKLAQTTISNTSMPTAHSVQTTCFADFSSNQTHPDTFPFALWTKVMREIIADSRPALMENSPGVGILALREAICVHLKQFRGMEVSPEQIIVGAGTDYLYGLLIQLLGHDKIYGMEEPGYQKISQVCQSHNVPCLHIPLDSQGICMDKLESARVDIVHISPSHHFPTGIITPISRRYELLGWASASDSRYIIEDDYDSEFRFMGKPIPSLQSIDVMDKVIYMNTFTKTLASTIRISYMVLPKHLIAHFQQHLGFYACTVSNFEQYTLTHFIEEGHFERHINRMRNFYQNQRDLLLRCLKNSPASPRITITEEDAGLHFLMHVALTVSDEIILQKAKSQGLRLACLSQYYHQESLPAKHTFVMNYSAIHPRHITEAIARLCQIFMEL